MRFSEADKMVDDMEAVKADMQSGDPSLMAHAFGTMASVMSEIARKCAGVPGLARMRRMLLDNAQDALRHKQRIEAVEEFNAGLVKLRERSDRRDEKRREQIKQHNREAGQPDMFGDE